MDDLLRLLGRFHFALNHFPVALICVAGGVEAWRVLRRKDSLSDATPLLLVFGALGAVAAAASGIANAEFETHGRSVADELERHRWMGIGTAALMVLGIVLWIRAKGGRSVLGVRCVLWAAAALVSVSGHVGGELVHGEGYLTSFMNRQPAGESVPEPQATSDSSVATPSSRVSPTYTELALPVLEKHCCSCHGPEKQKSKLRLDSFDEVFKDDRAEWLVVAGKPEDSELLRRVTLPAEDFDIMPPEGGPLSPGEIDALRRWIQAGALR